MPNTTKYELIRTLVMASLALISLVATQAAVCALLAAGGNSSEVHGDPALWINALTAAFVMLVSIVLAVLASNRAMRPWIRSIALGGLGGTGFAMLGTLMTSELFRGAPSLLHVIYLVAVMFYTVMPGLVCGGILADALATQKTADQELQVDQAIALCFWAKWRLSAMGSGSRGGNGAQAPDTEAARRITPGEQAAGAQRGIMDQACDQLNGRSSLTEPTHAGLRLR
jgi:hypothetical protein